ncbi:hypothetical protein ES703_24152 [subsurface metagenome]
MDNLHMDRGVFQKIKLLIRNRFALSGLALAITYAVFSILQLNKLLHAILEGEYYYTYQITFLIIMFFLFQYYLKRYKNLTLKFYKILIFGTVGGYFAGICAYLGMVCFVDFGFGVLVNTIKLTSVWFVLFVPSFFSLSWFFGGLIGFITWLLYKLSNDKIKDTIM